MEKKEYLDSIYDYPDVRVALSEHFDEGKEEGYAKGKAEERLAIAKLLLLQGVSMDIITKTTGLSEEEIKA